MAEITFKSKGHQDRFLSNMRSLGRIYDGKLEQEYGAALYILTCDSALWQKTGSYVTGEGIDIPSMLEWVDFSGGQSVLIKLAGNLFNGEQHLDPLELMRLDDSNFAIALTALWIRRTSLPTEAKTANIINRLKTPFCGSTQLSSK